MDLYEHDIYAIRGGAFIKFGITGQGPFDRMMDLQHSAPIKLELIGAIRGPVSLEKFIHQALAAHRSNGEWFHANVDTEAVAAMVRDQQRIELYSWLQAKLNEQAASA